MIKIIEEDRKKEGQRVNPSFNVDTLNGNQTCLMPRFVWNFILHTLLFFTINVEISNKSSNHNCRFSAFNGWKESHHFLCCQSRRLFTCVPNWISLLSQIIFPGFPPYLVFIIVYTLFNERDEIVTIWFSFYFMLFNCTFFSQFFLSYTMYTLVLDVSIWQSLEFINGSLIIVYLFANCFKSEIVYQLQWFHEMRLAYGAYSNIVLVKNYPRLPFQSSSMSRSASFNVWPRYSNMQIFSILPINVIMLSNGWRFVFHLFFIYLNKLFLFNRMFVHSSFLPIRPIGFVWTNHSIHY